MRHTKHKRNGVYNLKVRARIILPIELMKFVFNQMKLSSHQSYHENKISFISKIKSNFEKKINGSKDYRTGRAT